MEALRVTLSPNLPSLCTLDKIGVGAEGNALIPVQASFSILNTGSSGEG